MVAEEREPPESFFDSTRLDSRVRLGHSFQTTKTTTTTQHNNQSISTSALRYSKVKAGLGAIVAA